MPPFLSGYNNRKKIEWGTVFPTSSNLTDFPKLFEITADADIAAALASGGGIAVTLADGVTTVPLGLYPETALASGTILMRALFTILTAGTTGAAFGYLYFDASQTTTENKPGVVANGYVAFLPLEEDPSGSAPQILDWSAQNNSLTASGMLSGDLVASEVGKGLNLSNGYAGKTSATGLPVNITDHFSFGGWQKSSAYTNLATIFGFGFGSPPSSANAGENRYLLEFLSDYYFWTVALDWDTGIAFDTDNVWHKWDFTFDGTTLIFYRDGVFASSRAGNPSSVTAGTDINIGSNPFGGSNPSTLTDENYISIVSYSADWIGYSYQDESNNSATFSLGPLETNGGTTVVAAVIGGGVGFGVYVL